MPDTPFSAEYIKVGALLWYEGRTSMSGWNCPAVVTQVDEETRSFRVKSLDDMREQNQAYTFDINARSPTSRRTMVVTTPEVVRDYVKARAHHVQASIADARKEMEERITNLQRQHDELQELLNEISSELID